MRTTAIRAEKIDEMKNKYGKQVKNKNFEKSEDLFRTKKKSKNIRPPWIRTENKMTLKKEVPKSAQNGMSRQYPSELIFRPFLDHF